MKIIYILILSTFYIIYMAENNFETLLGKNISEASFMGIRENNFDENLYLISETQVKFLENSIENIGIITDKNKMIQRVLISLEAPIDSTFYKTMSDEYGSNYDVMVIDEMLSEDSSERGSGSGDDSFKQTLKQIKWSTKKGTINDDNINHIIWNKEDFQLLLFYNYNRNKMDVHFIKKE